MYNKLILTLTLVLILLSASTTAYVAQKTDTKYFEPISKLWIEAEQGDWRTPFGVHLHWQSLTSQKPDHYLVQQVSYPKHQKPVFKQPYRLAGYTTEQYITTNDIGNGERVKFSVAACNEKQQCSSFVSMEYIVGSENNR